MLCHVANMYQNITTVALYDTLGPDATRFVLNQTELTTMSVSKDYVPKLAKMKISDASEGNHQMKRLSTLVVFENDIEAADRALAE
jgi:long-subunit acyl-CoA synthetase (AMP-forming)